VRRLGDEILTEDIGPQFRPAVDGLAHAISGERFSAARTVSGGSSRRFLGWTVTRHWYFPSPAPTSGIGHPAGQVSYGPPLADTNASPPAPRTSRSDLGSRRRVAH